MRAVPILAVLLFSCADSPLSSTPTVGPSPAAPPGATAAATPTGPGPSVAPSAFTLPSGPGAITPNLFPDGEDLLMVWQEPDAASAAKPTWRVRFSRFHGESWSPVVDIAAGTDLVANWADFPGVGVGGDGTLLTWWFVERGDAATFLTARSVDHGLTWTALPPPYPEGLHGERGFVSWVAEPDGLRLFWLDGRDSTEGHGGHHSGATALRTALLGPSAFGPEEIVDPRACDCCGTDAVSFAGQNIVVYRDRDEADRRDVAGSVGAKPGRTPSVGLGTDGWTLHGCPVNGPAADARGSQVAVAWFTGADDRQSIRAAFSATGGATFDPPVQVASARSDARPIGRVDLLLEPDGSALVTWLSAEGEDGRVRLGRVSADRRTIPTLDLGSTSTARSGGFPKMARLGTRVVVAWTRASEGNVAVVFDPRGILQEDGSVAESGGTALAPTVLPDFEAHDLQGTTVSSVGLRGAPVLLNVWATWCGPCRDELPALVALGKANPKLHVLALSADGAGAGEAVRKLAAARAPGLQVLHPDATDLAARLGVTAIPATFLFDGEGRLLFSSNGTLQVDDPAFVAALAKASAR